MDGIRGSLVILACLLIGAWLTGVLNALRKLSWGMIRKLDPARKRALVEKARHWMEMRTRYRVLIRFLALMNLAVMAVYGYVLIEHTGALWALLAGAVATVAYVLVTEAIGHGLLESWPWQLLRLSLPVLEVCHYLLLPITWPACWLIETLAPKPDEEDEEERATAEDEIMSLVEHDARDPEDGNTLEATERRMIRGVFVLDDCAAKEIMTPRVDVNALPDTSTVGEVKANCTESGHSRVPVYRESMDDIIGIAYSKDLLHRDLKDDDPITGILRQPVFVPETKNIGDLLEEFQQTHNQLAVVIDEYGGTAGLVTIEDILEEIVGEIRDEYDVGEDGPLYTMRPDGTVAVDARTPVDEVNELLNLSISEEEGYDTIGGYVSSELGRIPKAGEVVVLDTLEVRILEADQRKITLMLLRPLPEEEEAEAATG